MRSLAQDTDLLIPDGIDLDAAGAACTEPDQSATTHALHRPKRPISVLVVVFTIAGEFLLMHRTKPEGFWQSVTGSLRPGESPRSAALRELEEETGLLGASGLIDLRQSRLFPIIKAWRERYRDGVCFNREHWFALRLPYRRIIHLNPAEHSQCIWLPIDRALHLASSWTNRDAMRLLAGLQQSPAGLC
jgi:dATP pyrophosphohydrolase